MYRNTLKAHAHALTALASALTDLAHDHRVAASEVERGGDGEAKIDACFDEWIATICEITAATERLLALEVELSRHYGMTWQRVADILGTSRQAAWERFATRESWDRGHRMSQLRRVRRAAMFRRMTAGRDDEAAKAIREMMQQEGRRLKG